jgi:hypothetical protein
MGRAKDPESKRSKGEDRHTTPRVVFHLPHELLAALETLTERTRRPRSEELRIALEEHLIREKVWTRPTPEKG